LLRGGLGFGIIFGKLMEAGWEITRNLRRKFGRNQTLGNLIDNYSLFASCMKNWKRLLIIDSIYNPYDSNFCIPPINISCPYIFYN